MANEPPTEQVLAMKRSGMPNNVIIGQLKGRGFTYEQISDALTQAEMKANVGGMQEPPAPAQMQPSMMNDGEPAQPLPNQMQTREMFQYVPPITQPTINTEDYERNADERIEEIAEAIINEKWQKMIEDVGDINVWKEKVKTNITSIKQELVRLENRFESLQKAIVGKVNDYDKNMGEIGSEIKALEKLLQKIIQPLTSNVNELSRITAKLKK